MKPIAPKQISYIAAICLLFILVCQAYLVYDYYQTTRAGLVRESDAILQDAFKKDLEIRRNEYKKIPEGNIIKLDPGSTPIKNTNYDFSKRSDFANNIIGLVDLALNIHISKKVPLNPQQLDSITGSILLSRGIHSKYRVNTIDPVSGKIIQQSKSDLQTTSFFTISSKYLTIDIVNNKALELVLINPFGIILKRMGIMLLASVFFSIICLIAFGLLRRILAKQKQLVVFKNEFLSTIAHELKRPVASLSLNLDCLSMPALSADPVKHAQYVNRSISATTELNDTINMIVALAKVEEGLLKLNKEPIELKQLIEDLKYKFVGYPVKKVEIKTVFETDDTLVTGDVNLLTQCFANLIDNAIKYSNPEVLIIITIRKTARWIVVSVKDNGFGIPEEKLSVIFDKYTRAIPETTRISGFGIGLNYVKTIVEKHRGLVNVKSSPGLGTEFSVLLPE